MQRGTHTCTRTCIHTCRSHGRQHWSISYIHMQYTYNRQRHTRISTQNIHTRHTYSFFQGLKSCWFKNIHKNISHIHTHAYTYSYIRIAAHTHKNVFPVPNASNLADSKIHIKHLAHTYIHMHAYTYSQRTSFLFPRLQILIQNMHKPSRTYIRMHIHTYTNFFPVPRASNFG